MTEAPLLVASNLSKEFAGFRAVDSLSLSIKAGTVHALIGPNGAGKTTVFNLLTRFTQPSSGVLVFDGRDITRASAAAVARMGLVRSFQISAVFSAMSVLENVRLALMRVDGQPYQFWRSERGLDRLNESAMNLLASVGLSEAATATAGELSYGRRRALEIVTTLALKPKLMLLDEPTSGMGQEDIGPITALIRDIARTCTVVIVEHNLGVVAELADHITVLARGRILAEGSYASVSTNDQVISAYLGRGTGEPAIA